MAKNSKNPDLQIGNQTSRNLVGQVMNEGQVAEAQIVDAQLVFPLHSPLESETPQGHRILWRLVSAVGSLAFLSACGGVLWMFGILMFTFSLDGANGSDLPKWLDVFMLVGWPVSIAIFAIVPSALIALGLNWKYVVGSAIGTGLLSIAVFVTGVVVLFSSIAH